MDLSEDQNMMPECDSQKGALTKDPVLRNTFDLLTPRLAPDAHICLPV